MMKMRLSSAWIPFLLVTFCLFVSSRGQAVASKLEEVKPVNASQRPTEFRCIVCDDIKDKFCEPWDHFTHSKNCYEDDRINKSLSVGCRKMVQTIGDRTYVSRQCTNLVDLNVQGCIDRVGTKKIKVVYCHCLTPECNAALPAGDTGSWALHLMLLAGLTVALSDH